MRVAVADTAHTECVERLKFNAIDGAIGMAHFDGRRFHLATALLPLEFVTNIADLFRFDDVRTPRGCIGRIKDRNNKCRFHPPSAVGAFEHCKVGAHVVEVQRGPQPENLHFTRREVGWRLHANTPHAPRSIANTER